MALAQPGECWIVTILAYFGNCTPEELPGFLDCAKNLPGPFIHQAVREAEPIGGPASFHYSASVRRHYELLSRFPGGLLVLGDAMCSFNPIHGQDMSVSAKEAVQLRATLAAGSQNLSWRFYPAASQIIDDVIFVNAKSSAAPPSSQKCLSA